MTTHGSQETNYWQLRCEEAERQRDELLAALEYIRTSTAPDGQWAEHAIYVFASAAIAKVKP